MWCRKNQHELFFLYVRPHVCAYIENGLSVLGLLHSVSSRWWAGWFADDDDDNSVDDVGGKSNLLFAEEEKRNNPKCWKLLLIWFDDGFEMVLAYFTSVSFLNDK